MSRLGPLVLIAALAQAASAAGTCKKQPPPGGPFGVKFIGEGAKPGDPCPVQGDTGDFREELSRQHGEQARGDVPVETDHDAVVQPPPLPPGKPVFPTPLPEKLKVTAVDEIRPPSNPATG